MSVGGPILETPAARPAAIDPPVAVVPRAVASPARVGARLPLVPLALFVVLVVLNLADLVTTRMVLDRGGAEGNPIMAPIIDNQPLVVGLKALCLAAVGVLIARSRRSPRMLAVVAAVDAWYVFVVGWNVTVLSQLL